MHRLLTRPATRVIRDHKPVRAFQYLSRSIATTPTRHFNATAPTRKRSDKAGMFGEGFEELVETGKLSDETLASSSRPTPESQPPAEQQPPKSFSKSTETPRSPSKVSFSKAFDVEVYFRSWSPKDLEQPLAVHGLSLFDYIVNILESPTTLEALAVLDPNQSLELKKRWLTYELDQENEKSHLPLLEFLLYRGLKVLPPTTGQMRPSERIQKIDVVEVQKAMGVNEPEPIMNSVVQKLEDEETLNFPDLMQPDDLLDPRDVVEFPPSKESRFTNRVVVRNHRSVFHEYAEGIEDDLLEEDELESDENQDQDEMLAALPVSSRYYRDLHQSILMRRGVVQQTGKGKIRRVSFMVLVGNGDGLVGYGEGKHGNGATALKAARLAAVRNMDWVERFEKRTIWTEMRTKLGATELILRPRPVGFGLRCNPHLHRILRAAGLKDISAKVVGSRNKLNVMKAAFRMLQAGHAPTGMGDGLGGKGKKLSKGGGLKSKSDLERARGRKLVNLRN